MSAAITTTQAPMRQVRAACPRAAYVHVPFCRHRCGYCNFTLVAGRDDLIDDYLRAVELELRTVGTNHAAINEVDTLYFGGGTPTYLSPEQLRRVADAVLRRHPLARNYEWTIEANPSDVNASLVDALSAMGVTRLSLGGQSFRPEKLRLLERDHQPGDIVTAVQLARSAGMQVALDLIFATTGETLSDWESDLESALAFKPDHISSYGLTFERGTAFWMRRLRGQLDEVDEELQRDMYALAIDKLTAAGFEHYEVSNFARPGCRSRHNETYWAGDGYFAYGPGAARYVDGVRETNHRSTSTYLKRMLSGRSSVAEREKLAPEAQTRELLVFGLRRIEGVSRREFAARTGGAVDVLVGDAVQKFVELGLLDDDGEHIRLTREGLFVSDAIWPELL